MNNKLMQVDPAIAKLIDQEKERQQTTIDLIASENYADAAIRQASASVLTNKYAEGYPGKRYYSGCAIVDQIELLAQERCKTLFGAEHVNVQPHSGSQANMAVYYSMLKPGDTILGMALAHGGHLTHGHGVNFSGVFYKSIGYTVDPATELIDYDAVERLAHEHKPALIIAGASSYSRTIDFERFGKIARSVNALLLADIAHIAGLVAAGLHPSPIPHADFVTSTTHKTLRGPRGGLIMCRTQFAEKLDKAIIPGTQGGPLLHIIAAKAVAFKQAQSSAFAEYQKQVIKNAQAMADAFINLGYRIIAGGTDNHLLTIDLRSKNITGLQAEHALEQHGITVNRNCIPFDPQRPWIASGIRIGTPAITTRGMKEKECVEIAQLIDVILQAPDHEATKQHAQDVIKKLCDQFPVPE